MGMWFMYHNWRRKKCQGKNCMLDYMAEIMEGKVEWHMTEKNDRI